jgi:hypothetical protein
MAAWRVPSTPHLPLALPLLALARLAALAGRSLSISAQLDSGSSWRCGVSGVLRQQDPDSLKQGYWDKGHCFLCQHLTHSRGASSYALAVFRVAATTLEMPT